MSLRHIHYAAALSPYLLPSRGAVLRALAAVADEQGHMALSHRQLARQTGWSTPTVKAALRDLLARGILRREFQRTETHGDVANRYSLVALEQKIPGTALARVVNS